MEEENRDMIEVAEVRDISVVTTEIKTLQRQFRNLTLSYAVEIGRRLREAKELLPHGAFGTWLKENVSFSQRQANNLMQLFDEYGADQITLLGAVPKSQAIANLSITKAIRLLALPEDERDELLENEDVDAMSTRELEAAIRARQEAEEAASLAQADAERLQQIVDAQEAELGKRESLEARAREAAEARDAALRELGDAKRAAEDARAELKRLRETPEIPPDRLAEIEREAKTAAVAAEAEKRKAAEEKLKKKLEKAEAEAKAAAEKAEAAAKEKLEDAERRLAAAEQAKAAAENEAARLRREAVASDPDVAAFRALFEQVQDDGTKLMRAYARVNEKDPAVAAKLGAAIGQMRKMFEIGKEENT